MPRVSSKAFVAPTATLIGDVIVEEGASIWFGAVLRGDIGPIIIKKGSNVQDNTVFHTKTEEEPTIVGENATIGHGAILHSCTIGSQVMVGIRAVVLDGAVIGDESIVAAGSVVGDNTIVPPRSLVAGIPAKVKKEIAGTSLWYVQIGAGYYHKLRDEYLQNGIGFVPGEDI